MSEIIKGKMFGDLHEDYDAFFEYGPRAMCWSWEDGGRRRVLWFLAPWVRDGVLQESEPDETFVIGGSESEVRFTGKRNFEVARIFTETDGTDWTTPGPIQGWDGNVERPTFNPSIWLRGKNGWHGFIQNGDLVTA